MAPFNLSDFAVKETKIPSAALRPQETKGNVGLFLRAHFLDFWMIYFLNGLATKALHLSMKTHLTTKALSHAWTVSDLSTISFATWGAVAATYFFCSYYLNHGQTPGLMISKCRVRVREHSLTDALQWSFKSISVFVSLGLITSRYKDDILAHDHLWHELVAQKEIAAPDVRSLVTEEKEIAYAEAA